MDLLRELRLRQRLQLAICCDAGPQVIAALYLGAALFESFDGFAPSKLRSHFREGGRKFEEMRGKPWGSAAFKMFQHLTHKSVDNHDKKLSVASMGARNCGAPPHSQHFIDDDDAAAASDSACAVAEDEWRMVHL